MAKQILIFRGGWDGHEPVETSDIVAEALTKRGAVCDIHDDQQILVDGNLSKYDVIVPVWTMGKISQQASKKLCEAILNGTGIAGWHGGMCDAFREDSDYQFVTGGQFVAHPGNCRQYRVEITGNDPIVDGIESFDIQSEQYYMHIDPGNEVLAVTKFDDKILPWINGIVMPVIWKRTYGKGKVFYSSLGHCAKEFITYPQILELTVRGILWAARD